MAKGTTKEAVADNDPIVGVVVKLGGQLMVGGEAPETENDKEPPVIVFAPTETSTEKAFVAEDGTTENVKEEPPFEVRSAEGEDVADTEKSVATAVVALDAPATVIVHDTGVPTLNMFVFPHDSEDMVVGVP